MMVADMALHASCPAAEALHWEATRMDSTGGGQAWRTDALHAGSPALQWTPENALADIELTTRVIHASRLIFEDASDHLNRIGKRLAGVEARISQLDRDTDRLMEIWREIRRRFEAGNVGF